ncbi:probable JmjC domain-containing histone demethylation protein 2C isoform X3 [Microtus ochrogaster]|uniref:Probable JmjC domain-containing histone demethylation protein 2C isoform X3 n=1 Tax=Microtus ochrogaster TaxID=79684 RepID=A0ABM1UI19_MICOH|nr:probable JmjC domain-containing histone demethylation protein 2C isoform X3 [Microtus ochrogaster]
MAVETRPELVGKRFLCVAAGEDARPERGQSGCGSGWRAGVIRAVSHRDSGHPDLAVYVEFDDLEWDKREWVKVYEDFSTFLVEYHLIWAKRNDPSQTQGSKSRQIQWPALTFKPLVENSIPSSITAVEFLIDKQLDFLTEDSAFQPYQDDIDSLKPVLRDNPQLHAEVKVWVKEQKVQEIFMQGPYSLNGYRVRVYRQDSATQWFTGIITHHDLFTRTMIVMNDQVLEPQNVDPSMVQMTFLDDVVHSLLKGENIGITSRRRSRATHNTNTVHGHYTRAQANSPRPAMNSQAAVPKQNTHQQQQQRNIRPNKRKGSDSSIPDEEKMKEEKYDYISRGENPKGKNKHVLSKRRKPEEEEKRANTKRVRTDNASDVSESSDSENSSKRVSENSSEHTPELKTKVTSKVNGAEGKSQIIEKTGGETLMDTQVQEDKTREEGEKLKSMDSHIQEKMTLRSSEQATVADHNPNDSVLQECNMENTHTVELLPKEKLVSRTPTPKCAVDIKNDTHPERVAQENSNTFGLQTLENMDPNVSDSKHSNTKYLETAKQDSDQSWVSDIVKVDLTQSSVINTSSGNDHRDVDKERNHYVSYMSSLSTVSVTEDQLHKRSPPPETVKSKLTTSVDTQKTKSNSSPEVVKPKITHSPDSIKSKAPYVNSQAIGERRLASKIEHELSRCTFHPVPTRSALETTKSPLIIDKNEHFTVYRDPALIGSETGTNHISPFLSQHHFPLPSSSHRTCLNPGTHHPALAPGSHLLAGSSSQTPLPPLNTHPLTSGPHHSVHHPHLLPTVLPGVPTASLLGGHPRLESAHASSLSHLALAHQQQQQLLQHQSPHLLGQAHPSASYNQLGLYPIIWQYPNGAHAYSGLGLPSSKWVHPENAVNTEASLRRNSPSPWLHQPTPVTSTDGIGLLSHIPVRPSSAEPHRPHKMTVHSSSPVAKTLVDHHKEELERKAFMEPLRCNASTSVKSDLDLNRSQGGKDCHLHRHFVGPRPPQETGERLNKYKEEHRRILQESIDVAPFTTKIKGPEVERENYSRVAPSSSSPKSHAVKQDKDVERSVSELYKMKHSVPQSLPQSNYFTTLSNSVVNEPPRSYPSKEVSNIYTEKQNNLSAAANPQSLSFIPSLSKPPPLIKHQPESETLVSKIPDHLPHQITSHSVTTFRSDCRSPTHLTVSSTNALRSMPALHRAPVFHPPIHHSLERKESSYSSLSPPTLTPVMPVNAGTKVQESQKPPTLIPEPKDSQANFKSSSDQNLTEMWKSNNNLSKEKAEWPVEKSSGKSQAAVASVIVRPPSSTKVDSVPSIPLASKDRVCERSSSGASKTDYLKPESGETGRVILPNVNLENAHVKSEKNVEAVSQGSVPISVMSAVNVVCNTKTDVFTSAATTTSVSSLGGSETVYSLSNTSLASTSLECTPSKSVTQAVAQTKECKVSTPGPVTVACSKTGSGSGGQPSSGFSGTTDFIHLKKHKAALLAAAQYKNSNVSEAELNTVRNQTAAASFPMDSTMICGASNKAISVGNGPAAQTSQPNYHTKLKKAWLTRHSEEDKNTNKMESSGNSVSEIIKPCSVNLIASTSNDIQNSVDSRVTGDKYGRDDKASRRKTKRTYESGSESGDSDESESKSEQRTKRQPKPTYKKKQNDLQRRKGEIEEDLKPNGVLSRSAKEKSKLKLQSSNSAGIPRSVLKDWRKVKKLKQTGESFLQDDSCCEIGPNLQKCRECRLIRSKKGEESTHSPVFCRFYYFRRLSFSKNGVVRIDGFSSPDQYDDEAMSLWTHENYEDDEIDVETSKYILDIIGDKFCQLVTSEKTALSWVKKDAKIAWKRAVRGVREMCDACEATLFNVHWVCRKCGFVACLDCYKAKERKSSRDKELYAWMKCVKGQPHDHKHLMPTQIIPGSVLTDLLDAMHVLREKYGIKSHCHCTNKQNIQVGNFPTINGVSQVLQNVLNHSNKSSLCIPESQQQTTPQKSQSNGDSSPGSVSTDSRLTPPESQSPLHWLADLAEQKAREEKQENNEFALEKEIKEEGEQDASDSPNDSASPPASQNNEQGSTLRDLLTTTAGKLRVGSTDAGIAFAPVYSMGASSGKSGRTMPNILDDIIASVVENKIPPNKTAKINVKSEPNEEPKESRKSAMNESNKLYSDIPHSWICDQHIIWLKDYKNSNNWKLFKECWKQGQPAVVSGVHKKMNMSLWKAESVSLDFGDHQADLLNCKDSIISNANVKEFWDGFEEISKRQKNKSGETVVLKLKDCPSGEDFKTMMPARYEDFLRSLPLPEYCSPEGKFNLASHLPGFFVRPDLGPRLCSAYGVAAAKDHDIGTTNLHVEASDVVNILVYVGVAKGNGVLSKAGILKKFEEEELDDVLRKRLKDSSELPGALWHIYAGKDLDTIREFLQKISKEQGLEVLPEHDPIRDQSWYVNRKLRQRLLEEHGVRACTLIQFLGDAIVLPAGTLHQELSISSIVHCSE